MSKLKTPIFNDQKLKINDISREKISKEEIKNDNFWNDCINDKNILQDNGIINNSNINTNLLVQIDIKNKIKTK